jgi:hypothetical protein
MILQGVPAETTERVHLSVAEEAKVAFCRPRRRSGQADGGHTAM